MWLKKYKLDISKINIWAQSEILWLLGIYVQYKQKQQELKENTQKTFKLADKGCFVYGIFTHMYSRGILYYDLCVFYIITP